MMSHDFDLKPSRFAVRQQLDAQYGDYEYRQQQRMCNMPFAAIGGAIAAGAAAASSALGITAAAGAIGAAAAGAGTIGAAVSLTVTAIANVAMVAGLAMTVVGAATGDKELMKIGGIVGLAGGVAGLATSAISGMTGVLEGVNTMTGEALGASSADTVAMVGQNTKSYAFPELTTEAGAKSVIPESISSAEAANTAMENAISKSALGTASSPLASAAQAGSPVQNAAVNPADVGKLQGASSVGSNVGSNKSALDGLDKWFSDYGKTVGTSDGLNTRDWIGIGGMAAQGMGAYSQHQDAIDSRNEQTRLRQAEFDAQMAGNARAYKNANTQGRLIMTTQPTPEQLAQLPPDQQAAYRARYGNQSKPAGLLTAAAGRTR
jgi:hypothetical protein